MERTAASRHQ